MNIPPIQTNKPEPTFGNIYKYTKPTSYGKCIHGGNKGLPAGVLIFYEEPDFKKPEQCTEEWLIEHQIVLPAMNEAEFIQLYNLFVATWNTQEH